MVSITHVVQGVWSGSGPSGPQDFFPFLSLPRELQFEVLFYTDLVTPLSSVKWDLYDRYHLGIERVKSCHPRNEAIFGPPYEMSALPCSLATAISRLAATIGKLAETTSTGTMT